MKFDDGAMISKISLPSDFSAVHLNNLPQGSTQNSVATLLSSMEVMISADDVRVITQPGAVRCSADIKVEDPTFAKTLCSRLRVRTDAPDVEAIPTSVPSPPGSRLHRVDCRRVLCSWHRPTRTAWLNFGTEQVAQKVQKRFNAGVYTVLGCSVKANAPTGQSNRRNPLAWTVMLTDLPGTAAEREICRDIPDLQRPRNVTMGRPSYEADMDHASTIVESMLLQLGPLEGWEVSRNSGGKRAKAQARFVEESHAREAVTLLDNKPLSFSKAAKLSVQLMVSAKFKVSSRTYNVLRGRLESQNSAWKRQQVYFVAYPPQNGYRVLKLEGQNGQHVAQAKKSLEHIIGGEVARKDDQDIWSAHLGKNGDGRAKLREIEKNHDIVIIPNRRKSQFLLFGTEENHEQATNALALLAEAKVLDNQVNDQIIELTSEKFQWACRGGFKTLESRLGNDKAAFDIVSTPKRVIISGSQADYQTALEIVNSQKIEAGTKTSNNQTECSVCWTEAEEPIRTSCNHDYCLGCFSDLCQAQASTPTEFCISCVGGQGRCEKVLALSELQELLSSAAFEDLLNASFASYVRRNPASVRYCPTPDCGQIYRPTLISSASSHTFTCSECLIPTCTACHSPHPDMTCAEHKDHASGGREAFEELKKKLGIKDCPKCKTAMEKTEGCNHMTCRGCGIHICWKCLDTFSTGGECYAHMNKKHGGIFDGGVYGV